MKKTTLIFAVSLFCLATLGTASAQNPGIYEAVNNSNIRSEASASSDIVGFLEQGSQIQVLGGTRDDTWYQVQLQGGETGYVHGSLLEPIIISSETVPVSDATTADSSSNESVETAAAITPATSSGNISAAELSEAPEDAFVYIISPHNGDTIPGGKVWVSFGLRNMGVAPAGIKKQFTGHHHLLIDTGIPPLDQPIPNDDNHVHFGRGQTEYFVELSPGSHTLQLLLGDHDHVPHNPPVMSNIITVFVP